MSLAPRTVSGSQGTWYPSAGVGFNLTRNFGVDAALYGTKTFLEAEPHVGLAISLRLDKRPSTINSVIQTK